MSFLDDITDLDQITGKPAFMSNEAVNIVSRDQLDAISARFNTESPLSLHRLLDPDILSYGNRSIVIRSVFRYHLELPVYSIDQTNFLWPELAFEDLRIRDDANGREPESVAAKTYHAEVVDGQFAILDTRGRCFCRLRKHSAESFTRRANYIASIRSRIAFECLYDFEGDY